MKTMFFQPRHKEAARRISIESVPDARASAGWLNGEWEAAQTRDKRRRLIRYATLAKNRATAMRRKAEISPRERAELREVASVYNGWLRKHRLRR